MFIQKYNLMRNYSLIFLLLSLLLVGCNKDHEIDQSSVISPETSNPSHAAASSKTAYIKAAPRSFVNAGLGAIQISTEQIYAPSQVKFCQQTMPKIGVQTTVRSTFRVQVGNQVRVGDALTTPFA